MFTSEQIRELRMALGWGQTELAFRIGVSQNTVARWESGDRNPSRKHNEILNKLLREAEKKGFVLATAR